jgi:hypothetical protein
VQENGLFVIDAQAGPRSSEFDLGNQEWLSFLVDGVLRDPYDLPGGKIFLCAVFIGGAVPLPDTQITTRLPVQGSLHLPFGAGQRLPYLGILLAGVQLRNVIHNFMLENSTRLVAF